MNDKVLWVTGASSGIGAAVAKKFAKEGWKVAISARRTELLDELAKNENIFSYPLDVMDSEKCKEVFNSIVKDLSKVDLCFFCTGIHDPKSEKNFNLEKIEKIMKVNFFGTINSINPVYEYFKQNKSGHISIVSSVAGFRGLPAGGAYCASKSALTTYAESLYFDMKRFNVKISVVHPGFIKTPMTDQNDFPMPMIKTTGYAAEKIFIGLTKSNAFEIHFPKSFTYLLKIIKLMPNWLYFNLINFANKYMKR